MLVTNHRQLPGSFLVDKQQDTDIIVADDTTATAAFHKSTPTVQQDGTVHLVKRQGRWLVHEVLNVPKLPRTGQQPRTLSPEETKALQEKYSKNK